MWSLPLVDHHCFQVIPLSRLRLNLLDDRCEIWVVLSDQTSETEGLGAYRSSSFSPPQASSVGPLEVIDEQASTASNQCHEGDRSVSDSYLEGAS